VSCTWSHGQATLEVAPDHWSDVARALRDEAEFRFEQLIDVCGVDYLSYGDDRVGHLGVSSEGFSPRRRRRRAGRFDWASRPHPAGGRSVSPLSTHLLSVAAQPASALAHLCGDDALPVVPSW
jgi:NADH-quinone oxidoreductase subunit C